MRTAFFLSLTATVLLCGFVWYQSEPYYCQYPLTYTIGDIDDRFQLTENDALQAVEEAERLWEEAAGINLLAYDPSGDVTINFIYDERQNRSDREQEMRSVLEELRTENSGKNEEYVRLVVTHKNLQDEYDARVVRYDEKLESYNQTVQEYNQSGGAPPEAYAELDQARQELEAEADTLSEQAQIINDLTQQINVLGDEGNQLVAEYNRLVSQYNEEFGQSHEFTQGDYQDRIIQIYTFSDEYELQQVLAHELGHALGVGHVENPEAVMYHLLGAHIGELQLTEDDINALTEVCTASRWWDIL